MNQKNRLILNTLINVSSSFLSTGLGFFLVPIIIGSLGRAPYGIWIILGSFFAYANMFQMGLNSSITRYVPYLIPQQKFEELNQRVNSVVAYYILISLVLAVVTFLAYFYFSSWFSLDPEFHRPARIMVLIVGISQIIYLPIQAYSAVLSGMQRYDLSVGLNTMGEIVRALTIIIFLSSMALQSGMIFLAGISASILCLVTILKAIFTFRLCPSISFRPWNFNVSMILEQMGYGLNSTLYTLSGLLFSRMAVVIVGIFATTSKSADYGIAMMLILVGVSLIGAFNRSIKPVASRYHGENNMEMLRKLLIRSSRYNSLVVFSGAASIVIFGPAMYDLWIGSQYTGPEGAEILTNIIKTSAVLVIGYVAHWLLEPAFRIVNGMGKHFFPAVIAVVAGIFSSIFIILAARAEAGIAQIGWSITVPMLITWGVIMPVYCCRVIQIPIKSFYIKGILIPLSICVPVGVITYLGTLYYRPDNWIILFIELAVFSCFLLIFSWIFIIIDSDKIHIRNNLYLLWQNFLSLRLSREIK